MYDIFSDKKSAIKVKQASFKYNEKLNQNPYFKYIFYKTNLGVYRTIAFPFFRMVCLIRNVAMLNYMEITD